MVSVKSMDEFNAYFRQPTVHPLVSVGDLSRAEVSLFEPTDFGMYCVVLMDEVFGELIKGGNHVQYRPGTLFSLRPGQTAAMILDYTKRPSGWMLAFRPELLEKTGLGRDFYMFNYFSSDVMEAVELNTSERSIIYNCFANIFAELHTPSDYLSGQLIRLGIGQLLSYFKRFYERQFTDSLSAGTSLAQRLDNLVDNYLSSGLPAQKGQPTVAWCAAEFNLSPNYFGDLVKRELHITAQDYLHDKIMSAAKHLLLTTNMTVGEIAEELGFAYPNHFTRMFTRYEGTSPLKFRRVGLRT
ncbi:MAG: AraC family transcriptional regulator [Bacteroidaceae bacterium]|nr:AraC family transcriptional regulator [Bacteroidaceae bacterium]